MCIFCRSQNLLLSSQRSKQHWKILDSVWLTQRNMNNGLTRSVFLSFSSWALLLDLMILQSIRSSQLLHTSQFFEDNGSYSYSGEIHSCTKTDLQCCCLAKYLLVIVLKDLLNQEEMFYSLCNYRQGSIWIQVCWKQMHGLTSQFTTSPNNFASNR